MTVQCINCDHISLKASPLGKVGFSVCAAVNRPWETYSPSAPRECKRFVPSDAAAIEQRIKYLKGKA